MKSRTQTPENTQANSEVGNLRQRLAKARHARTRERAYAAWYTVLLAYGHLPGPPVDVVSGSISPSRKRRPEQGPCQMM